MAKQAAISDIRAMSDDQIAKRLKELSKDKFNQRFQKTSGQMEDTSVVRATRREVAKLKTVLRERELEAAQKNAK